MESLRANIFADFKTNEILFQKVYMEKFEKSYFQKKLRNF